MANDQEPNDRNKPNEHGPESSEPSSANLTKPQVTKASPQEHSSASETASQPASSPRLSLSGFAAVLLLVALIGGTLYLAYRHVPPKNPNPPTQLIIVQLNDIYRLDAVRAGKRGGLARVVTVLRQLKAQNPQVPIIVLHAGDFLSPSLESSEFNGIQMIDAMNFIHEVAPLYVVPGNHEFDYSDDSKEHLTNAIAKSRFPWIASNLERNDSALLPALRDKVASRTVVAFGTIKLGIFGLTIDGAQEGGDRPYAPISGDYDRIARSEIQQLEREGANLIVGLTHLNVDDDRKLAKLKQEHPRFLWIAGGHEHSLDHEQAWPGAAMITKGDSNARTIWKISVVSDGVNPEVREESIVVNESIQPDAAFKRDVEDFYAYKLRNERPYLDTVIANSKRCYDATEESVRDRESDWGDLLTDNMRNTYKRIPADVAVLNGGSIRVDDTICDEITFEDLERTFAYPTPIVFVKLNGKDLKEHILDDAVKSKRGDGRFLQVSGVSFRRERKPDGSSIIKDLQVESAKGWVAFDENKTYVVAVNKYLFDCGDKYKFREHVTDYIPAGPDLRALTYATLFAQTKNKPQSLGRIIDLPPYVKPVSSPAPKWQTLSAAERRCS